VAHWAATLLTLGPRASLSVVARRSTLRASDADREHVADRLRHATAEGRLSAEELEDRLGSAFAARTYGELDPLVADIPGQAIRRRERSHQLLALRPVPLLMLFFLMPVVVSVVIAAVVVLATVFAAWAVLVALGLWFFGHGRRRAWMCHGRHGRWTGSRRGVAGSFSPWL
jgi:DUF1707 SHOCT-like domain